MEKILIISLAFDWYGFIEGEYNIINVLYFLSFFLLILAAVFSLLLDVDGPDDDDVED